MKTDRRDVFGSDQGLVGRFNEVIVEFAVGTAQRCPAKSRKSGPSESAPTPHGGHRADAGWPVIGSDLSRRHHAPRRTDSHRNRGGSRTRRCRRGLCIPQPSEIGSRLRAVSKRLLPLDHTWQTSLPRCRGQRKVCRRSSRVPSHRLQAFIREYLFVLLFRPAPNPLPAKTPAAWRRCNARKRTSKKFWKT